ncbi:secreted RxLR effector protein 161-like [Daucus carota subsp. sativus]|uniref:secreted RxLR effector protein 161-like n=1 Tax=Daucus carota subsp. sativus TaxID=79200 RepID=UPI0030827163
MVGGLRHLVFTRPDIAYSVGIVSRFMERPIVMHLAAAKRIFRYVNGTLDYGLVYSKRDGNYLLSGYSNSDLVGNVDDKRSTRECGEIILKVHVNTNEQRADVLTKALSRAKFEGMCELLGVKNLQSSLD